MLLEACIGILHLAAIKQIVIILKSHSLNKVKFHKKRKKKSLIYGYIDVECWSFFINLKKENFL